MENINFNAQHKFHPKKDIRPSSSEALVSAKTRDRDVRKFDEIAAKRPLKPPTKSRPKGLAEST